MRKLLTKAAFFATGVFLLTLILYIVASNSGNSKFEHISKIILNLGMPLFLVLVVTVVLIMIITGKTSDNDKDEEKRTQQDESNEIQGINSSKGYENRYREAEFIGNHAARNYANSTIKEKILGWLFLGFLISTIMLAFVFLYLRISIGFIICWCVFVGTIIISGIVKAIIEKISFGSAKPERKHKDSNKPQKQPILMCGNVVSCLLSSSTSVSTGERNLYSSKITSVVYRVKIAVEDKTYTAYSNKFYEKGELVLIKVLKRKLVSIIDFD